MGSVALEDSANVWGTSIRHIRKKKYIKGKLALSIWSTTVSLALFLCLQTSWRFPSPAKPSPLGLWKTELPLAAQHSHRDLSISKGVQVVNGIAF